MPHKQGQYDHPQWSVHCVATGHLITFGVSGSAADAIAATHDMARKHLFTGQAVIMSRAQVAIWKKKFINGIMQ